MASIDELRAVLGRGLVIPACPLALNASRQLDERRQRALCRYYAAAGAGGIAVGVHTTQFSIRDRHVGLLRPVLELAADECRGPSVRGSLDGRPFVRIAGVCGPIQQAIAEAQLARELGYDTVLLSLSALQDATDTGMLEHCREIAAVIPVIGFYLQEAVGGRPLTHAFWRKFAEIEQVVAVKIAPFCRYKTLDVVRAVAETGRDDIALYTGNDDNIVLDLLTPFRFSIAGRCVERRFVGGLLGHWAVWTRKAVEIHAQCRKVALDDAPVPSNLMRLAHEVTDSNAALFDAAHRFAGCIAGLHEVLRRQGLFEGTWCLNPAERLSPGQSEEIDRVYAAYPHLNDDAFVATHHDEWLRS
jgi:dihydrodipicolinate synthase/N-acetylneuraminate lyase